MKLSGWIFMLCSWSAIISLMIFAYRKVLRKRDQRRKVSGKTAKP